MKLSNSQFVKHLAIFVAVISLLVLGMIFPFLPGEYDPLAMPLSLMIQVFGIAGLLLTIDGVFWLLMPRHEIVFAIISLFVGKLVMLILALVATFSSGKIFGIVLVTVGLFLFFLLIIRLKHLKTADRSRFNPLPLYLIVLPVMTLILQLVLIKPVTHWSRERAIANANEFINHIENYHTSSLGSESERLVQEDLEKLMHGRTSLIIAYRLSTIRTDDKIIVIDHGTVAESGSHNQLIAKEGGIYKNLSELQFEMIG